MNLKLRMPAMNKNLFFGLWFVLFAALVLLLNWLFRLPVHQADRINGQVVSIENRLIQLKAVRSEYLLDLDREENLFVNTGGKTEEEAGQLIASIRKDIESLVKKTRIARDPAISSSITAFSDILNTYKTDLNDFFSAVRERGNENAGLIMRWTALSDRMLKVSNPPADAVIKASTG
jgi:hypothetical protein